MNLGLIGVPYNSSGLLTGEARAPAALRAAGLLDNLRRFGDVVDYGNVSIAPPTPNRDPASGIITPLVLVDMVASVRLAVERVLSDGRLPLVIGGDCPLLLGCLAGTRDVYGRIGLLFVDGHEDAWPPPQSPTGEAADMELGLALGLTETNHLPQLQSLLPLVLPSDVAMLGPRDRQELLDAGVPSVAPSIAMIDDTALRHGDVAASVTSQLMRLRDNTDRWWFHLDLDVLATDALPAVRYQQPNGLEWAELEALTAAALCVPGLAGWNITIYNPDLDPDGSSAARIVSFLSAMAQHVP
jgi:arginase